MTTCPVCQRQVPAGEYCGACGAHLASASGFRLGAFAADPGQHVLQPNAISVLFPHLLPRESGAFRLGFLIVAVGLCVLGILRLTGPAIAVAAASVPVLYVLYFHRARVGDGELLVIVLTFGIGLVLGVPWAIVTGPVETHALLHDATAGVSPINLLVVGVLLSLAAQLLMLVGALLLYLRRRHHGPIDGFTFGAATGLGFALATALVNLAPELHRGLVGGAPAVTNALTVLGRGLLIPFLDAGTTALLAGALWLRRRPTRRLPLTWIASLPAAVAAAVIVRVVLGIVGVTVLRPGIVVTIYLIVAAALLLWLRLALHAMVLSEEGSDATGSTLPCPNCHHPAPRMLYCPHCGISMQATPPTDRPPGTEPGRVHRGHRAALEWGAAAGLVGVGALALGVTAAILTPSRKPACGVTCPPPPPPCLATCAHASPAPPLRSSRSYTSSTFGYSVDYAQFDPSHQDDTSIGWDLATDVGQYQVDVLAARAGGRGPQQILADVIDNNFPDYSLVYEIPGAEIGYVPGAGAVYDDEVAPFFGVAADTRLAVLTGVRNGLAIAVVGDGDASSGQSSHPDPSGLPISPFVDSLANGTRWPGQPPR